MRDVLVVGAGPVGIALAAELTRRGVDVEVYDRRPSPGAGSRAIGIHSPVLSALEPSGVTERLLAQAVRVRRGEARSGGRVLGVVRFDRLSRRFPFVATLPQATTEAALAEDAPEPLRGALVTAVLPGAGRAGADRVRVRASIAGRPIELAARLVVVATGSGGRDLVYRPGAVRVREYRDRYLMTDAAAPAHADDGIAVVNLDTRGVLESFPLPDGRRRFVAWDRPDAGAMAGAGAGAEAGAGAGAGDAGVGAGAGAGVDDAGAEPTARLGRLRDALTARGEGEVARGVEEATAFAVRRVVATALRNGRIFVIGDAAHEVSPIGGQGMNLGLLDAMTLAPLLHEWLRSGEAPERGLHRWQRDRVASAQVAARLAAMNTALGRPLPAAADAARRLALRAMLAPGPDRLFAHAYAMGFDRAG